ncbi:MAG: aldehyde dehydrogenase family protein, partial [Deltaproteobacteria bacterium]|nr:aldehyde dehydrogenase family protein [Deltaproteobacteria bacterium]
MAVNLDERRIDEIVERVVQRLGSAPAGPRPTAPAVHGKRRGIFDDLDTATAAALRSHEELVNKFTLADRQRMVQAMRECARRLNEQLAQQAVAETGLGRVDSKIMKLAGAIRKTPGPEMLQPIAWSGDDGLTLTEWAPWGVIGSITPTTNPTETVFCNAIGMISAGNAVVFNVHPGAKKVSADFVVALNDAIVSAGGPDNLLCSIANPTIESAQALM